MSCVPVTVPVRPLEYLTWGNAFYHIYEVGGRRSPASHATLTTERGTDYKVIFCLSVHVSVCLRALSWSHLLIDFSQSGTEVITQKVRKSSLGVTITPPLPLFCTHTCCFWLKGPENPCKHKYANFCLKCS